MKKAVIFLTVAVLALSIAVYAAKDHKTTEKPVQTNPTINTILNSGSTRAFSNRNIEDRTIDLIIKCGIKAPSAMNKQPWHFSVVKDRRLLDKINAEAPAGPPGGAGPKKPDAPQPQSPPGNAPKRHMFSNAPVVIIISATVDSQFSTFDAALACQNMSIAAQSLGLGSRIVASPTIVLNGSKEKEYRKILQIPDGKKVVAALLLGYPDKSPDGVSGASTRNSNAVSYIR